MKQFLLSAFLLSALTFNCFSQPQKITRPDNSSLRPSYIDSVVNKLLDTADITGLQIGIVNENKISYVNSYGFKDKPKNELNDPNASWYAASLAKPLFGYIVMQLADEGKIDLDKPLYTYLPKPLPDYDAYKDLAGDDRYKQITARMCLDHTTGFPNWRQGNPHNNNKLEIFFTPGTRYSYSGEGIQLLQLAVETVTGRKLEDLAQEKVFKPFGMSHTSYVWQPAFEKDFARPHDYNDDTIAMIRYREQYAAGSMQTTVGDYCRFMIAAMQGKRLSEKSRQQIFSKQMSIYSKRQFDELTADSVGDNRAIDLSYGLGWGLFKTPNGQAFFKEGHAPGWVNYVIGVPDKKYALVILCNDSKGESIFKELVERIAGIEIPWFWESYLPYRGSVKLPQSVLQEFTGEYDGKIKAMITLVNGQLKVESPTVNLGKTNLYATNDHHFFLKIMDTDIEFVKDANGKVLKAVLNDEGDHYELTKVK